MKTKIFRAKVFLNLLLLAFIVEAKGQNFADLKVGDNCPDFKLGKVHYFNQPSAVLNDFKGKWLILDFWASTCSLCISGFPKFNNLQKEFAGQLQVVLVGNNDQKYNKGIEYLFDRIRIRQQLTLPVAYDSLLFKRFGIGSVPYAVVIDPNGVIRALTSGNFLNKQVIRDLMMGKSEVTEKVDSIDRRASLYRSEFSKWDKSMRGYIGNYINEYSKEGKYNSNGMSLLKLYNVAYFGEATWRFTDSLYGKVAKQPILEVKDSTAFINNAAKGIGYYSYSLVVPKDKSNQTYLQFVMQGDLQKYFGYNACVEEQDMPCWFLTASENTKRRLKTKAKKTIMTGDYAGFSYFNVDVKTILNHISRNNSKEPPIFDQTGIKGNIDLEIEADLLNFYDVRRAFEEKGLMLVEGRRKMKVLVIRDR